MIPFINGEKFSEIRVGSIENGISNAKAVVESHFGCEVDVLATHGDHLFVVIEGEDCIRRIGLKFDGSGVDVISNRITEGFVSESNRDRYISDMLREAVDQIMSGEECNRLHALASLVRPDGRYIFTEEFNAAMQTAAEPSYWAALYETNRKEIRKAVHGTLGEDEALVPKTRYSTIQERKIKDYESEIHESLEILFELVQNVSVDLDSMSAARINAKGWNAQKVIDTMKNECHTIVNHGRKALELSRNENLPEVAMLHDRLAESVKTMLIMRRFAKISTIEESNR
jgi:hypothetical protein